MAACAPPQDTAPLPAELAIEKRAGDPLGPPQPTPAENGAATHEPSAQAHDQTSASSSEADRDLNPNGSHTVVSPDERDSAKPGDKDKDKDKSSLAATTNTHPNTSSTAPSHRRLSRKTPLANQSPPSTSSGKGPPGRPLSRGGDTANSGSRPSPKKPSLISKLVRKLVPCIAPSARAHAIEVDRTDNSRSRIDPGSSSRPTDVVVVANEKRRTTEEEKEKEKQPDAGVQLPSQAAQDSLPSAAQDPDTHPAIPTLPKAVLPPSEPDLTNTSVQPPAPGTDIFSPPPVSRSETTSPPTSTAHSHPGDTTHTTLTESESSFTDEAAHPEAEEAEDEEGDPMEEDDEDTLIMNGGAGIPIGPVSGTLLVLQALLIRSGRYAKTLAPTHCAPARGTQMSRP